MQIIVDGILTEYQVIGEGKTILLVHGWGDSYRGLMPVAEYLSKFYRIISLSLPGFGQTQIPANAWKLEDYCIFINSFLKKIDTSCYAMIGHSNGAAIVIKGIALKYFKTQKLVLLASAGVRNSQGSKKRSIKTIVKFTKIMIYILPKSCRQVFRRWLYKKIGSDYLLVAGMEETFKNIVSEDIIVAAKDINVPTLLIYGQQDRDTPVQYGLLLQQAITGSRLEILENCGHFVHLDQPLKTKNIIEEFLNENN